MARETTGAPKHLRPHHAVAERVLLPDDPAAALRLAQALMVQTPLMLNHNRGLWGYAGTGTDGEPLTVQSTGTGGPSAAIVVAELAALGARRLVRVGTCVGTNPGEILVADPVVGQDGTSAALGASGPLRPGLVVPGRRVPVVSVDLLRAAADGEGAVDLESAAVLAAAAVHGLLAAVVLVVTAGDHDERAAQELAAGRAAAQAFGL